MALAPVNRYIGEKWIHFLYITIGVAHNLKVDPSDHQRNKKGESPLPVIRPQMITSTE